MKKFTPKIQQQGQIPGYKTNTKEKEITHTQNNYTTYDPTQLQQENRTNTPTNTKHKETQTSQPKTSLHLSHY